jgi:hypothetical protein
MTLWHIFLEFIIYTTIICIGSIVGGFVVLGVLIGIVYIFIFWKITLIILIFISYIFLNKKFVNEVH